MSYRNSPAAKRRRRQERQAHRAAIAERRRGVSSSAAITLGDTDAEVEHAKRQTHDNLIIELGDDRRSGVRWMLYGPGYGVDAAAGVRLYFEAAVDLPGARLPAATHSAALFETADDFLAWIAEHPRAVFVVAIAETANPAPGCEL